MDLIKRGKTKEIFSFQNETGLMKFMDLLVDGEERREYLEGKGAIGALITNYLFSILNEKGVNTHLIKMVDDCSIQIHILQMIPLEIVIRGYSLGSFSRRYNIEKGRKFTKPVVEFFYKNDSLDDPLISPSAIIGLGILTDSQIVLIEKNSLKIWDIIFDEFLKVGIELLDIKIEYGIRKDEIYLGDEIGFDTFRIRDLKSLSRLDKDIWYSGGKGVDKNLRSFSDKVNCWRKI